MVLFWIACILSAFIVVAFLTEAVSEFNHLRARARAGTPPAPEQELQADAVWKFSVKASAGAFASFICLILISTSAYAWVLMPALSLGSAVAVIAAFRVDRKARRREHAAPERHSASSIDSNPSVRVQ